MPRLQPFTNRLFTFQRSLPFDQRGPGFPRIVGSRTDMGAFEAITFDFNGSGANADSNDLVWALQAGRYNQSASFSQGDANGDGVFDAADVTAVLNSGLYQTGPIWYLRQFCLRRRPL